MSQKVDMTIHTSREVLDRFTSLAARLNATKTDTLIYLMDFYDEANLTHNIRSAAETVRAAVPTSGPACLHAYVASEVREKFRQIAAGYGMTHGQLLACIIEGHERRGEDACVQAAAEAPARESGDADGDPMGRLEAALDVIRDVCREAFRANGQGVSGNDEIRILREQLAAAEADAEKARESNRKMQDMLNRLVAQLG